jgi:hypothetical protein
MIIIEKCKILEDGLLVILTSKSGHQESYTRLNSKDEFQRIATLVIPNETHGTGWIRKEL